MIKILWLIFTGLFLALAFYNFYRATKTFKEIPNLAQVGGINGAKLGIKEGIDGFNKYIGELNRDNWWMNVSQGIGYTLAAATAVVSFCIS